MKISMLMGTLNRKELMIQAVKSILNQSYQNFEIIIIDQSDKACEDIMLLDNRIIYKHIMQKGLSHARNIGLSLAMGDIIGLMDDDAIYMEKALEYVNDKFENNINLGLVAGAVIDPNTNKISLRGMNNAEINITKRNIFKCCISPSMFIKKSIFNDEKFDEKFGIGNYWGSAEETDIALKVLYHNMIGSFCPDIIVKHPGSSKKNLPLTKLESYSRGYGAICAKHLILYHNKTMKYLYYRALCRALCGLFLSLIRMDSHMIKYYKASINAKQVGYNSYKKMLLK